MNLQNYLYLLVFVILLQIICNSSADEWKKLKRKLIALTLLHSIRVKTIIPLPVPLPLPVVIKKHVTPVVLPPKRVPFLVPKPVPYFQIIPNFVPIYTKDTDSHEKQWSGEDGLHSAQQLTHEDYLIPSEDHSGLDTDYYKLIGDLPHPESVHNFENPRKHDRHKFHHDQFIDPFELKAKHKFPKYSQKFRKQKSKPFNGLREFNRNKNNEEKYEDLLMVSSALKSEPQDKTQNLKPVSEGKTDHSNANNHRLPTNGQTFGYEMSKQLLNDWKPKDNKNNGNGNKDTHSMGVESPGIKTVTKKIKVGEIRLQAHHLKSILEHHTGVTPRK